MLALALLGCPFLTGDDDPPVAPGTVREEVHAPRVTGEVGIATAPERAERVAAKVREAPLPTGEAIYRDCHGSLGWMPPSRGIRLVPGGTSFGCGSAGYEAPSPIAAAPDAAS